MKSYRILVGIPTGGSVQGLTVQSLVSLLKAPITVGDVTFELEFGGCLIGAYIQWNVAHLFELTRRGNYVGALRIDSDMSWTQDWMEHFFTALAHLTEHQDPLKAVRPWALGGVYPRRQPLSLHVPVVAINQRDIREPGGPITEREYLHWTWSCYQAGATVQVGRIGGGFTFYSAGAAEIPEQEWMVRPGIGEDYALCEAIASRGGAIYGCWPSHFNEPKAPIPQGAQLYHGIGHELHTLECYFQAAREAGLNPDGASDAELLTMHNYGRMDSIFEMRRPEDES